MDGDVESNLRLQSIRCGLGRPTDGDVATQLIIGRTPQTPSRKNQES